jgi:tetratricopeptide (TPR) repeat protein
MRHLIIVLALSLVCGRASADSSNDKARASAREHYAKGTSFFDLGRYDDAITEYSLAYEAKNEPTLLYNIAQAHRLGNHPAQALRFYKMYLTRLPDAANRAEVETKIAALEHIVEQQKAMQAAPPQHPEPPARTATTHPEVPTTPTTVPVTPAATPAPSDVVANPHAGRGKRIAGIVIAAAVLAIIGGGIATGVLAQNASDKISAENRNRQPYDEATYNAGKTDQILEGVLLGVGGAAVVTGGVLYFVGRHEGKRAQVATVAPILSPTSAGLAVSGSF